MRDARGEPRYLCSDLVELRMDVLETIVRLENISASGACVQCEVHVPEAPRVCLVCRRKQFRGLVRYSDRRGDAYFVGIVFDPRLKMVEDQIHAETLLGSAKGEGATPAAQAVRHVSVSGRERAISHSH